jgi:hypothetical protein
MHSLINGLRGRARLGRDGVALPLALLGLVAVSLLVTAALVTSSTEAAISGAHQDAVTSLYGADEALHQHAAALLREGAVAGPGRGFQDNEGEVLSTTGGTPYLVKVSRLFRSTVTQDAATGELLRDETFSLVSSPAPRADETERPGRMVGALIDVQRRGPNPNLNISAGASLASDDVDINGSIMLSGRQDASLCATGANVNAVDLASNVDADIKAQNVDGGATEVQRSTMDKEAFARYLLGYNDPKKLAAIAGIKFGFDDFSAFPSGASPNSDTYSRTDKDINRSRLNWGCPHQIADCNEDGDEDYYPVIAIRNPGTAINPGDGFGQGILIVEGDLHLNSKFRFNGIVIVQGDLQVNGNAQIQGALVALGDVLLQPGSPGSDGNSDGATLNGNALVRYNSCNIAKAIDSLRNSGIENAPQTAKGATRYWFEVVR